MQLEPTQEDSEEVDKIKEEYHIIQKESLKLTRNRNGYTWEIKILEINIERMENVNNAMLEKFGGLDE